MPTNLNDLTDVRAAARRALRRREPGSKGAVDLWSVWNEPNLQQFLTPQYVGKKIVSPAQLRQALQGRLRRHQGRQPGGEGRDRRDLRAGPRQARDGREPDRVSPGMFAQLLAKQRGLKFDAWAHHPYPTSPSAKPLEQVRFPNVTLSTLPTFEKDIKKWFHHTVPMWITEYGHETKPGEPHGVTLARQAAYAKQALTVARNDPNVQMFIWFTFRDSSGNPWQSGLEQPSGAHKPAYAAFSSLARAIDGSTHAVAAGRQPTLKLFVPYLSFRDPVGSVVGVTYRVFDGKTQLATGQPTAILAPDQSVTVSLAGLVPKKHHTYRVIAAVNDINGNIVTRTATLAVA